MSTEPVGVLNHFAAPPPSLMLASSFLGSPPAGAGRERLLLLWIGGQRWLQHSRVYLPIWHRPTRSFDLLGQPGTDHLALWTGEIMMVEFPLMVKVDFFWMENVSSCISCFSLCSCFLTLTPIYSLLLKILIPVFIPHFFFPMNLPVGEITIIVVPDHLFPLSIVCLQNDCSVFNKAWL